MKPSSPVDRRQCVTCGKDLPERYSKAEKCRACHQAAVTTVGRGTGVCVDCGKKLRNPASARCRPCFLKNARRSDWEPRGDDWQPRGAIDIAPSATTAQERAYAAGMVDGEGHLGLAAWGSSFLPTVEIINTDANLMDWFTARFAGGVIIKHTPRNPKHSPRLTWRLNGRRAYAFLQEILPYLVIKREQAQIVFDYYDQGGYFHHGNDRLPAEEIIRRAELHLRLKAMTARGPKD